MMNLDHHKLPNISVFSYIPEGDFFILNRDYVNISNNLDLVEWNEVVWIGRLFAMDNDFGEHWFDNGELREEKAPIAKELGLRSDDIFVIDPKRFQDGRDGPCNTDAFRKQFWTDVLKHLQLNLGTLIDKAKQENEVPEEEDYLSDLDDRIVDLIRTYAPNYPLILPGPLTRAGIDQALVERIAENLDSGMRVYLDKSTQEIRCLPEDNGYFEPEMWQEDIDAIEQGDHWEITPMYSSQSYKIMEGFITQVEDERLRQRLARAIDQRKPFRHFKAIIDDAGDYRDRWFAYKAKRYADYVVGELSRLILL